MDAVYYVAVWVLAASAVSVIVAFALGSCVGNREQKRKTRHERELTLRTLVELLDMVARLTSDVDSRSAEIKQVHRHVWDLKVSGELEEIQHALLRHISSVLMLNQELEGNLVYARSCIEQQAQEIDRTRREARTDALSGVHNRKAFDEKLDLLLGLWDRKGEPFVLVLADVDHFKWVNDTHGHPEGDQVLTQLARQLTTILRERDFLARYGGDEFAILLPRTTLDSGIELADRIRMESSQLAIEVGKRGDTVNLTLSLGVAAPHDGDRPDDVIRRADDGLYRSKNSGRNQLCCAQVSGPTSFEGAPSAPGPAMPLFSPGRWGTDGGAAGSVR